MATLFLSKITILHLCFNWATHFDCFLHTFLGNSILITETRQAIPTFISKNNTKREKSQRGSLATKHDMIH